MKKKRVSTETKKKIKVYALSILAGLLAYIISMVIFALIISNTDVPAIIVFIFSLIASGLFAFVSSFLLTKIVRKGGLITGGIIGVIVFIIISIISFMLSEPGQASISLINLIATVAFGILGGVLGVNSKTLKIK